MNWCSHRIQNEVLFPALSLIFLNFYRYKNAKHQLNFDIHISSICRKASQQLNILKPLGRYLDRLSKLTIFHTFILSIFSFCPLAWHFCIDKNSKKLEKVQERAFRFVYDDYTSSYINLLEKALVPSLQIRRNRTMALETYKIVLSSIKTWKMH
jgi:hypothetical protein